MMEKCWCGGDVGRRTPGDRNGVGCLESIYHDWAATGAKEKVESLYVAGPMSGYQDCNYPKFNNVAKLLRDSGYTVMNPAETGNVGSHYVDLLREDLKLMLECDGLAVLDNWWESTGARNEVSVAALLNMPVRSPSHWMDIAQNGRFKRGST